MATPPTPPLVPPPISISPDALDRLLDAIGGVVDEVRDLKRKVDTAGVESKLTNTAVRDLRQDYAHVAQKLDAFCDEVAELRERADVTERNLRRHDSGFRQVSTTDEKRASDMAALVIAIEESRKLSKKCLEKIEQVEKEQAEAATETKGQTTVLAKVETQTKTLSTPTKAAAVLNLVVGLVYLFLELLKHLAK